jgi:hypothetical protein
VTDAHHPGDVILQGTVTEYKPNNQLMVILDENNSIITPTAQAIPEAAAVSSRQAQIATVIASVWIQARLVEVSTHRIVWAGSYSYEGLDLATALEAAVGSLKWSMGEVIPRLNERKST